MIHGGKTRLKQNSGCSPKGWGGWRKKKQHQSFKAMIRNQCGDFSLGRRGTSFGKAKKKNQPKKLTFWLQKEKMEIERGDDFCFSHPALALPELPSSCPSQGNYLCLCKIINCERTFQVLMRSSNTGLWLKVQSCIEALITVMMHEVETIILLASHSPSCVWRTGR